MANGMEYDGLLFVSFPGEFIDWEGLREIMDSLKEREPADSTISIPLPFVRAFEVTNDNKQP